LHMAQLMPLPLTVSCFSKIQIGFTFLVPAHPGSPGQRAVKRVCDGRRKRVHPNRILCRRLIWLAVGFSAHTNKICSYRIVRYRNVRPLLRFVVDLLFGLFLQPFLQQLTRFRLTYSASRGPSVVAELFVTSLCLASYVCRERDAARIYPPLAPAERRPCSNRSMSPAIWAHSSKPAAAACGGMIIYFASAACSRCRFQPCDRMIIRFME